MEPCSDSETATKKRRSRFESLEPALAAAAVRAHIDAMHPLHLTKVAVGCASAEMLAERMAAPVAEGGEAWLETRYRPTRHPELVGGSLYWIVKHRLVVRQEIVGFAEAEGGRCRIRLGAEVVPVRPRIKRAHQGWRYLTGTDAPADFDAAGADLALMPAEMVRELAMLALI